MAKNLFIVNKYSKWYFNIIENAKTKQYDTYHETHHIIPRCMGGTDDKDNLVKLSYREHFICHCLLPKFCKKKQHKIKMVYSLIFMLGVNEDSKDKKIFTSYQYEYVKKIAKENLIGENNPFYGKKHTEESRKKMSEGQRLAKESGKKLQKHTDETKEKLSIAAKNRSPETKRKQAETLRKFYSENNVSWYTNGKDSRMIKDSDPIPDGYYPGRYMEISEETRRKKSEDMKGEKNHFYGKKHSKETKEKIYTPENRKKISDANSGRIRYTDGIREIRLKKDEIPPEGFVKGTSPLSRKRGPDAISGRIRYNNGIKEIRLKKGEIPPEGFVKGRLKR
jgi:hypothetical protein